MDPELVIAGTLRRDYLLPPSGRPLLDVPGGDLLYAAAGAAVWKQVKDPDIGLLGRVGEDYPHEWLRSFEQRGFCVDGIRIRPEHIDLRAFRAYLDPSAAAAGQASATVQRNNPVTHFARLGIPYPKSLLGYQPPSDRTRPRAPAPDAPIPADIPSAYHMAQTVHLCPLDHVTDSRLITTFRQAGTALMTLDPPASLMAPAFLEDVHSLLHGLAAFLPAEEELRALFWGRTDNLWEMAEALALYGCNFIVIKRGGHGQMLYDSLAKKRWEIPAYAARLTDPTGAGDSFCGGFIAGLLKTRDPLRAVLHGSVSASLTIEGSGAFHALDSLPGLARARLDSLASLVRQV
jgi:ribokinase